MRSPRLRLFSLLLLVFISAQSPAQASTPQVLSDKDKLYGLSVFWKEASYNFAYFDQVKDLDWDAAYQQYIGEVLQSKTDYDYYRVLSRFAALLNDGMTTIEIPLELVEQHVGFPAIQLAEANHQAIVTAVAKDLQQQLPLGSVILEVDGRDTHTVLKQEVFPYISSSTQHIRWDQGIRGNQRYGYGLLAGQPNSTLKLTVRTPDSKVKTLSINRLTLNSPIDWHTAKQPAHTKPYSMRWLDDKLAYVALNNFSDMAVVDQFKQSLPELQKAKAMILDLRFNEGGNTFIAEEILKHLTFRDLTGARSRMRVHNSTYKAWGKFAHQYGWAEKYDAYFQGNAWEDTEPNMIFADEITSKDKLVIPTVILISRATAKAAEDFLVYADGVKHFKTIGEPTFGSTGQPLLVELPGGGSAKICSKRETFADGRDFVGFGIQPSILVKRDADYYLSQTDITLDKAYEWLSKEVKKGVAMVHGGQAPVVALH